MIAFINAAAVLTPLATTLLVLVLLLSVLLLLYCCCPSFAWLIQTAAKPIPCYVHIPAQGELLASPCRRRPVCSAATKRMPNQTCPMLPEQPPIIQLIHKLDNWSISETAEFNAPATAWRRTWPSCRLLLSLLQPTVPCQFISSPDTTMKAAAEPMWLQWTLCSSAPGGSGPGAVELAAGCNSIM